MTSTHLNISSCPVCTGSATESHFGAVVCRACSAFFRRRTLSKQDVECLNIGKCEITADRDIPQCRFCRMEKCLKIGMKIEYVQTKRDRHNNLGTRNRRMKIGKTATVKPPSFLENYSSVVLSNQIPSTSIDYSSMRLRSLHDNFSKMLSLRKKLHRKNKVPTSIHFAESLEIFQKDVGLVAQWILSTFPELTNLDNNQQRILFRNFYSKFTVFEPAYIALLLGKPSTYHVPTGDTVDEVGRYYTRHLQKPPSISVEDVSRLFLPFWADFRDTLMDPVIEANLSIHEFLLICSIFLWDVGLDGQSIECETLSNNIKQQLYKELNIVCKIKYKGVEDSCLRFAKNMLLLPAIQRGVVVYEEELQLGGLYRVLVTDSDDWYDMVKGPI